MRRAQFNLPNALLLCFSELEINGTRVQIKDLNLDPDGTYPVQLTTGNYSYASTTLNLYK